MDRLLNEEHVKVQKAKFEGVVHYVRRWWSQTSRVHDEHEQTWAWDSLCRIVNDVDEPPATFGPITCLACLGVIEGMRSHGVFFVDSEDGILP